MRRACCASGFLVGVVFALASPAAAEDGDAPVTPPRTLGTDVAPAAHRTIQPPSAEAYYCGPRPFFQPPGLRTGFGGELDLQNVTPRLLLAVFLTMRIGLHRGDRQFALWPEVGFTGVLHGDTSISAGVGLGWHTSRRGEYRRGDFKDGIGVAILPKGVWVPGDRALGWRTSAVFELDLVIDLEVAHQVTFPSGGARHQLQVLATVDVAEHFR